MLVDIEARKAAEAKAKDGDFIKWLEDPMTRLGNQLASKGDADAMRLLMRSAFDAGWERSAGHVSGELMKAMFEGMQKRDDRRA